MLAPLPPENDTIYWVDMGLSTISRAKRDQTWREDVVTNGIGRVEGIAVDWIAGELWEGWWTAGEAEDWGSGVSGGGGVRRRGRQEQKGRSGGLRRLEGTRYTSPHTPPEHPAFLPPQATSTGRTRVLMSSRLPGSMALSATWSSPRVWTSPGRSRSTRRRGEKRGGLTSPHSWLWSGQALWPQARSPPCSGD